MIANEEIGHLLDMIVYNQSYAPDYPTEDKTTLENEFGKMKDSLIRLLNHMGSNSKSKWLKLAQREVDHSFEFYSNGLDSNGYESLSDAERYCLSAQNNKSYDPGFIVGPDGFTESN